MNWILSSNDDITRNPTCGMRRRVCSSNGGSQIRDLLTRLAAHEQVTIQANFENQQMTFPLHLVEDEFHALHLRLGVPSIYEDGPLIRPWRLVLEEPVALENAQGQPGTMWVHEVSFKGVPLEVRNKTKAPKHFALRFSPSGYERIALRGTLEKETEQGFYAYQLSQDDKDGNRASAPVHPAAAPPDPPLPASPHVQVSRPPARN